MTWRATRVGRRERAENARQRDADEGEGRRQEAEQHGDGDQDHAVAAAHPERRQLHLEALAARANIRHRIGGQQGEGRHDRHPAGGGVEHYQPEQRGGIGDAVDGGIEQRAVAADRAG
jgi:hypothetical protein